MDAKERALLRYYARADFQYGSTEFALQLLAKDGTQDGIPLEEIRKAGITEIQVLEIEWKCIDHREVEASKLKWDPLMKCFVYFEDKIFYGIETDGHIHT